MTAITLGLAEALSTVQRPGNFCTDGTAEFLAPHLEVEGVGPIASRCCKSRPSNLWRSPSGSELTGSTGRGHWNRSSHALPDAGSFFVSHRDTEKVPGMFATLVIVLPSRYTGGALVVRHRDREMRPELCRADPSEVAYAAFYADCVHEVLPVTSGCRLTLVYNLRWQDTGPLPTAPDYAAEKSRARDLLLAWGAGQGFAR